MGWLSALRNANHLVVCSEPPIFGLSGGPVARRADQHLVSLPALCDGVDAPDQRRHKRQDGTNGELAQSKKEASARDTSIIGNNS